MVIFGNIENGRMVLNEYGNIVNTWLCDIPIKYPNTKLDSFVIMPNHIHTIINIVGAIHESPDKKHESYNNKLTKYNNAQHNDNCNRAIHELPLQYKRRKMVLSKIIGYIKMQSAKQINILRGYPAKPVWQRNFYDHIIRNDKSLNNTREYICTNPATWDKDIENPDRIGNIEPQEIPV
jgi:REP element-mobilizing transposase RayT